MTYATWGILMAYVMCIYPFVDTAASFFVRAACSLQRPRRVWWDVVPPRSAAFGPRSQSLPPDGQLSGFHALVLSASGVYLSPSGGGLPIALQVLQVRANLL
jgi:hypothetical protein